MKTQTLRLSVIIIAVIVAIGITTMTLLSLQNNIEKQNQEEKIQARVHATSNLTSHEDYDPFRYVRISDFAPNSAIIFSYPFTGNQTFDTQGSHKWNLIRLPSELGGNKDDISSFRAYSMMDIAIGCNVVYRPQSEKLVDWCHDDTFEPVNGIAVAGNAVLNKYNALPNLDLGVDDQGYIYVKQPVFEYDKNGLIGAGRNVFHCTDPQQANLQYDMNRLTTRQQIESILLSDARIQKIILGNSCEFMGDSISYTENGTYRGINVNLNNTEELSAAIHLQNRSVVSYDLSHIARTYSTK